MFQDVHSDAFDIARDRWVAIVCTMMLGCGVIAWPIAGRFFTAGNQGVAVRTAARSTPATPIATNPTPQNAMAATNAPVGVPGTAPTNVGATDGPLAKVLAARTLIGSVVGALALLGAAAFGISRYRGGHGRVSVGRGSTPPSRQPHRAPAAAPSYRPAATHAPSQQHRQISHMQDGRAAAASYPTLGQQQARQQASAPGQIRGIHVPDPNAKGVQHRRPLRSIPNFDVAVNWEGELQGGADWGTWLQIPAACRMAVQMTWGVDELIPVLYLLDESGTPRQPAIHPTVNAGPTWFELPAGTTYVAVQQATGPRQDVKIEIWLPPAQAAAVRAA
jgi:hypothetical protein